MTGLAQLTPGAPFEGVFAVREVERRLTRGGKPFLSVVLSDATGSARGVIFDQPDWFAERMELGKPARVAGRAESRNGRLELLISHVRPAEDGAAEAQLVPRSHRDPNELFGFVLHLADEIGDAGLRRRGRIAPDAAIARGIDVQLGLRVCVPTTDPDKAGILDGEDIRISPVCQGPSADS